MKTNHFSKYFIPSTPLLCFLRIFKLLIFLTVFGLYWTSTAAADENAQIFVDGVRQYKSGAYSEAAAEFKKLTDKGISNGKLFYNLGNAYLKAGELGHSILWYERAMKLIPGNPDLKFNHQYAVSLTKDEKTPKGSPVLRILFFWKYQLTDQTVYRLAAFFNLMFWVSLTVFLFIRIPKQVLISRIFGCLAVVFTLTAFYNYYEDAYIKKAVILPEKVSVRAGLSEDSTELFVLHSGTAVKIDQERDGYVRIRFSDEKIGWLKASKTGII